MLKPELNSNEPSLLPLTMLAMVMETPGHPLIAKTLRLPVPSAKQVLVKIIACGVCRTDLHIMDSELSQSKLPLIPGHEIIGKVAQLGSEIKRLKIGDLVGIPWLGFACGYCKYCQQEQENLCDNALFTGYTIDGGYAEYTVAFEDFCFSLPEIYDQPSAAPLLCAGMIGYRSYTMINKNTSRLGIYGFGAAAHILIQVALHQGKQIYAFTKDGDLATQAFAKKMGAVWAGDSSTSAPELLDSAIIFAPVGPLVPKALKDIDKGGTVVCGGIHMSDIPAFPYQILWGERILRSVANLTRQDGREFFKVAASVPVKTKTRLFPLLKANEALSAIRNGKVEGAVVLVM